MLKCAVTDVAARAIPLFVKNQHLPSFARFAGENRPLYLFPSLAASIFGDRFDKKLPSQRTVASPTPSRGFVRISTNLA